METTRVCIKVTNLRSLGYPNLREWLKEGDNVYVGRAGRVNIDGQLYRYPASKWKNPYKVEMPLEKSLELYKRHLFRSGLINQLSELQGKTLGCWCKEEAQSSQAQSSYPRSSQAQSSQVRSSYPQCHAQLLIDLIDTVSQWWIYLPQFLTEPLFEPLYAEVSDKCQQYSYGEYLSRRISCVFGNVAYETIPSFDWEDSKVVMSIKEKAEDLFNQKFDYCLVHIYRDGNDSIGWHNDKEALDTGILSISLGATRKFRLKPMGQRKGWEAEYSLKNGDAVYMKSGCQRRKVHTVPVEKRVKEPRINLTFRQYEN